MPDDEQLEDGDEELDADYAQLDELEKLETIILLMEELGISTLEEARTRFDALERTIDSES